LVLFFFPETTPATIKKAPLDRHRRAQRAPQ
jgi:hypothetical protein